MCFVPEETHQVPNGKMVDETVSPKARGKRVW